MSTTVLPALSKAAALPELAGRPEFGFLRAQAVRERNRVVAALEEARRLAEETLRGLRDNAFWRGEP